MRDLRRTVTTGIASLALLAGAGQAADKNEPAAVPMRVPLFRAAPTIDGRIDPDEWRGAHAFEGFRRMSQRLEQRRVRAWVGATEDTIYLAIKSQLPDEGQLRLHIRRDSTDVAGDDAIEVYLNPFPGGDDTVDYQFLVNSGGFSGYHMHMLGNPDQEVPWRGNWTHAHGMHDGWWHCEIAIPIHSMAIIPADRKTTDGLWAINLCRNWQAYQWSSLSGGANGTYALSGVPFAFVADAAPAVQLRCEGHHAYLPHTHVLSAHNPSDRPLALHAHMHLYRDVNPEIVADETFTLAPGETKALRLAVDDPTTRVFALTTRVAGADDATVYYERETRWDRSETEPRWATTAAAPPPPLQMRFAYYPSRNILRVEANISGMPEDADIQSIHALVREHWTGDAVKTVEFPLDGFVNGRQERRVELPPLEGHYDLMLHVVGDNVPVDRITRHFERTVFPWEGAAAGRSTEVFPPFTPLRVAGNTLHAVLRTHELNAFGLLDQITATSAHTGVSGVLLAEPMRYTAIMGGEAAPARAEASRVVSSRAHEVVTEGAFSAGALDATWQNTWDYDGCVKVELTLHPTGGLAVDDLTLEIPFTAAQATLIHANSDMIRTPVARRLPAEQGELWNGSQVVDSGFIPNFTPYVYVGNAVRGLCWFAENDRNWGWDPQTPNMRLVREGDRVVLRVHLINRPTVIDEARTITFGMLAAPVKPRVNPHADENPHWWRHRFQRDRYWMLGTDINWFAVGNPYAGPFYPVGKDLYLWEMLSRSNREGVSSAEIDAFVEYGRKHYLPGGKGQTCVQSWVSHARGNMSWHQPRGETPGNNMVFYYNRAAGSGTPDEFRTFRHEWSRDEFGEGGYLAPPESYINFTLYWFARSFEIGNNKGVYVDEWFIAPNTNTEMTDAYRRADGSIVPAAGIWALREWQKRTFVMMNERGMLPFAFPHMTSFSPLPMLAFATAQYDWEWKYSAGDVQTRYTRDMLQLLSTGEQAGVWPVPLHDHGRLARDPWTQRTFAAVRILHELDGTQANSGTRELLHLVWEMLDKPGLEVYRYWDERPQPVTTADPDIPTIVYAVPGKDALAGVVSYARQDEAVTVRVDLEALGLDGGCTVTDAESGERFVLGDDGAFTLPLKRHDIRLIRFQAAE